MGRAGAKRGKTANDESPSNSSASKKRRTEKKKITPKKVERKQATDPFLEQFCAKFKHPEDAIQFLIQNAKMSVSDFFKKYWGTKPLAMQADEASKDLAKILTLEFLEELIDRSENGEFELIPERDFVFAKVVEDKVEEAEAIDMSKEILKKNYEDKFAVQFNQPQRFQDCIWSFVEKLESYFGSLTTCQALFVPKDTKSHTLRYDDTERFILQLSGSSSWKLHLAKGEQSEAYDDNLTPEQVGEECLAATLKSGDVLYIPKGIIFQSKGEENGVYLDFGTFQNLTSADLLGQTVNAVIGEQVSVSPDLRKPLPAGFLLRPASVTNVDYAEMLRALLESVKTRETPLPVPDSMIQQFMTSRLPPYGLAKFEPEQGEQISLTSKISLRNKEHITWYVRKSADMSADEEGPDEETSADTQDLEPRSEMVVLSSLNNERNRHMTVDAALHDYESDAFSISADYKEMLDKLAKSEGPIKVESLTEGMKNSDGLKPLVLAQALNNIGAITVSK